MTHAHAHPHVRTARRATRAGAVAAASFLLLSVVAPSPAAASSSATERREDVLHYTNKARKDAGCKSLKLSERLTRAAQKHADDMSKHEYFDHTSLTGITWDERIRAADYDDPGAENIAMGYKTAKDVVESWMDSKPHRKNIETCSLKKLGVGYNSDGRYWVQDFGY